MLTKEQEDQIKEIFKLKKSSDKECRLLGCSFLKQYNLNKIFIQCSCRQNVWVEGYWGGHYESIQFVGVKPVSKINSANAIIMILNNLDKKKGEMAYPGGNKIIFPVLKAYNE